VKATITGDFDTRRDAELVVERVVQEFGIPRSDVFVEPAGSANSAGTRSAGADAKTAPAPEGQQKLEGALKMSVDFHGDDPQGIIAAMSSAGAKNVRTK